MIVQIIKSLSRLYEYVIYLNNFFSSIDLFMILKALRMRAVRTTKQSSEFDENLLKLKTVVTKEKNWGTTAVTTVKNHALCMIWQNNNTVLLMTTTHWSEKAQKIVLKDLRFRHHISEDFVQLDSENKQFLPFSRAVMNYNLHMGEVDENAQQREQYFFVKHRCWRYWWSLFLFHLNAAVLNVYILYKLTYSTSKMTRARFQKEVTTSLMRNPAESIRQRPYDFSNSNSIDFTFQLRNIVGKHLPKKAYLHPVQSSQKNSLQELVKGLNARHWARWLVMVSQRNNENVLFKPGLGALLNSVRG